MIDVHLHGRLAEEFGPLFRLDIRSLAEAARALEANFPGRFYARLAEGDYRVTKGDEAMGPEMIRCELGRTREIHITPVVAGAKTGGLGQIIVGALLVAAAVTTTIVSAGTLTPATMSATAMLWGATTAANVAMLGAVMMLGGMVQMLSPAPKMDDYSMQERPEDRASFIYNGPVNTQAQGGPVPLVFGLKVRVGSVIVSGAITPEAA